MSAARRAVTVTLVNVIQRPAAWWRGVNQWVKDGLLAAILLAGSIVALATNWSPGDDYRTGNFGLVVLTITATVPLVARRKWPLAVLIVVSLSAVLMLVVDYPDTTDGI